MANQSLAERLGYTASERLLIVNCDDLGVSHAANVATLAAMTDGVATSATLMVPCPFACEAAAMFTGLAVGVHLTLTSEYPGYRWASLTGRTSLHDDDGYLPRTTAAAMARMEAPDVRAECRAQIDRALAWGLDVTHLDAHMHAVEARADLFDVYLDLAVGYGLPVRMITPAQAERLGLSGFHSAARAAARGVVCNDHLVYPWPHRTRDVFFEESPALPAGVSEIFAHPAGWQRVARLWTKLRGRARSRRHLPDRSRRAGFDRAAGVQAHQLSAAARTAAARARFAKWVSKA